MMGLQAPFPFSNAVGTETKFEGSIQKSLNWLVGRLNRIEMIVEQTTFTAFGRLQ